MFVLFVCLQFVLQTGNNQKVREANASRREKRWCDLFKVTWKITGLSTYCTFPFSLIYPLTHFFSLLFSFLTFVEVKELYNRQEKKILIEKKNLK